MKVHLPINYADDRGSIRDIFVSNPKDHCCIITFTEGSVRANHFHKLSTQYTYLLDGELTMFTVKVDSNGVYVGEVESEILQPGDLVTHPPLNAHAFIANKNSSILAFADGLRGGDNYESDVYRLDTKLI